MAKPTEPTRNYIFVIEVWDDAGDMDARMLLNADKVSRPTLGSIINIMKTALAQLESLDSQLAATAN